MTKERKASATWYVAATHFITGGLIIPGIIIVLIGAIIVPVIDYEIGRVVSFVVALLAVTYGAFYSARFLRKTYIISEPEKVIRLAVLYSVGLVAMGILSSLLRFGFPPQPPFNYSESLYQGVIWLCSTIVFFIASKKFVKATGTGSE